jgi:succinate dehydrogenase/fumarate reductase flavoprotein subunit
MIVFGFEAGKWSAAYARQAAKGGSIDTEELQHEEKQLRRYMEPKEDPLSVTTLKDRLKQVMERHVFVVRRKEGLTEAISEIETIERDIPRLQAPGFPRFNLEWLRAIEFPFIVEAARIAASSALEREESRGSHYRSDFPREDDKGWLRHTVARLDKGKLTIGSFPVALNYLRPEG